jgi:hypothetical protein
MTTPTAHPTAHATAWKTRALHFGLGVLTEMLVGMAGLDELANYSEFVFQPMQVNQPALSANIISF